MSERRIDELAAVEFTGSSSLVTYSKAARNLLRDLTYEFDFSAHEIRDVLAAQSEHPVLAQLGMDFSVKHRAKKVSDHLNRARDATHAAAIEVVRFNSQYRQLFAPALEGRERRSPKRKFDFEE